MHETHQIEESLPFSPAECFSLCPSSAAAFHICLVLSEQLPQKSVGVILILKLNLCLTTSLKSALCRWGGERAPYAPHGKITVAQRRGEEEPTYFATEISDTASLILPVDTTLRRRAQSRRPLLCPAQTLPSHTCRIWGRAHGRTT